MKEQEIRKTLEKQLQLLSERSEATENPMDLCQLTEAMAKLVSAPWPSGE